MNTIGENITGLSTSTPLLAGGTWTSDEIQLGQWNSISVIVLTDRNSTFVVHWSSSSINYDYTETFAVLANIPSQIPLVTVNKWVYFTLTNTTGVNQTFLRLNAYGTVTNNAVQLNIPSSIDVSVINQPIDVDITGQPISVNVNNPQLDVEVINPLDNVGNVQTVAYEPIPFLQLNFQNMFNQAESSFSTVDPVNGFLPSMRWEATDPAISFYQITGNALTITGFELSSSADLNKIIRLISKAALPSFVNRTMSVSFNVAFIDISTTFYFSDMQVGVGLLTDIATTNWTSGFSIVYGTPVSWNGGYTKLKISYWTLGVQTIVTQNNFNIDTLDGNGPSTMTIDPTLLNDYRIQYVLNGRLQVMYSVYNRITGKYVDFHSVDLSNISNISYGCGGTNFIMEVINKYDPPAPPVFLSTGMKATYFAAQVESSSQLIAYNPVTYNTSKSTDSVETFVAIIRNPYSFQGKLAAIPAELDEICFSNIASTHFVTIRIYKNVTTSSTGSFADISQYYSPLQRATSATITDYGVLVGGYHVGPNGTLCKDVRNLMLNPGENLVITGQMNSGSSETIGYSVRFNHYMF